MGLTREAQIHRDTEHPRIALPVLCIGILLAVVVGVLKANPELPTLAGSAVGIRLRMMRLAQIAFIALPLLTLLYEDLMGRAGGDSWLARWGWTAMVCGMIGLPSTLTVAGLTYVEFKFFLPLPAVAMFIGTVCGVGLARRYGRPLEHCGWLLIAFSMAAGLVMGLFAFDGPLPPPPFIGPYDNFVRRVIREAHAYAIVVGFISILISRQRAEIDSHGRIRFWR